jgi:hypothetical protein
MQDFAPFIPELLGTLSGPQTLGRKGRRAICLLLFNFLLLLQNLLTSLHITQARFLGIFKGVTHPLDSQFIDVRVYFQGSVRFIPWVVLTVEGVSHPSCLELNFQGSVSFLGFNC